MSITRCPYCDNQIDTDEHPEHTDMCKKEHAKNKTMDGRFEKLKKKFEKDLTGGIDANNCGGMMLVGKTWEWVLNEIKANNRAWEKRIKGMKKKEITSYKKEKNE